MAKKLIENNKQDNDLKLLEEVNSESFNTQFLENTPDISIKGRGKLNLLVINQYNDLFDIKNIYNLAFIKIYIYI